MVLTTLIAASMMATPVEEFFPLALGTKWTYEDADGRQVQLQVGESIDVGNNRMAIQRKATATGLPTNVELFAFDGDSVQRLGFYFPSRKNPLSLLEAPQTVLRVAAARAEWSYSTNVFGANGPMTFNVKSESNKGPRRKVLDREVETVVVRSITKSGSGATGFEQRIDTIYGKGIGMVETTEATKVQGKTVKKVLKLVKFEPAQG